MATQSAAEAASDRVLPATRVLAAIVIPFLVAASYILYLFPDSSGARFAWPIKPHITAMALGAAYLGGVVYFASVLFARRWHTVRLGFLPVTTFATILGIATLLHWDKFTPGHPAFIVWAALYLGLPFVIPVVWYLNERASPAGAPSSEPTFSAWLRTIFGLLSVVVVIAAAVLLVAPALVIPLWPWAMTPLTGRVMASIFALAAVIGLGVALDGHWSSVRVLFASQVTAVALFLLAAALSRTDIHWEMLTSYTFVGAGGFVLALIAGTAFQVRRARHQARSALR